VSVVAYDGPELKRYTPGDAHAALSDALFLVDAVDAMAALLRAADHGSSGNG
jgi:hypothetical protein